MVVVVGLVVVVDVAVVDVVGDVVGDVVVDVVVVDVVVLKWVHVLGPEMKLFMSVLIVFPFFR